MLKKQVLSNSLRNAIIEVNKNNNKLASYLLEIPMYDFTLETSKTKNITINSKGELTFLPAGKECILNSAQDKWSKKNRQSTGKWGKFFKKVLKEYDIQADINDKIVADFVNKLKCLYTPKIRETQDKNTILYCYNCENYSSLNTDTLSNSCMRYSSCQNFITFYTDNNVSIAYLYDSSNKVMGRALLWETCEGYKVMDRIYGNNVTIESFKRYAHKKGYAHKKEQNYDCNVFVLPNGEEISHLSFDLKYTRMERVPFVDTFCYMDLGEQKLYTHQGDRTLILQNTNGTIDGIRTCWHCDCPIDDHESCYSSINDQYYCTECCVYSEWYDTYIDIDDALSTYNDDWILLEDSVRLYNGEYAHKDDGDIITLYTGEYAYMHDDDVIDLYDGTCAYIDDEYIIGLYNGKYAHIDDTKYCEECDQFYLIEDMHDDLCIDCAKSRDEKKSKESEKIA